MTDKIALSLAELVDGDHPSQVILETFRDYAEGGAGISIHSVKSIVDKAHLSPEEIDQAYEHMQTGLASQISRGQAIGGLDYLQAMNYLAQIIGETMPEGSARAEPSSEHLVVLKSQLVKAHNQHDKASLERAVEVFKEWVLHTNPGTFEEGAVNVNLVGPGPKGMFPKAYNLTRYGGSITTHAYVMGIQATDDLQIVEAPAKR